MGVFDFVQEAGAKVGIGDSKEEKNAAAAAAAAASAAKAAEVKKKLQARKAELAKKREAAAAKADETAARAEAKAARVERLAENKKARGLESYVRELGLDVDGLDVRFDDGRAEVSGKVADQATREKVILAIGNVEGVGTVDDELEVVALADEADFHVVEPGDSLSKIAKEVYGDASKYPVIFEANKPMLTDPDLIFPGQVLRIPAL